jgi:hypothetical protein
VSQLVATDEYLYKTGGTFNSYQIPLPELDAHWESTQLVDFTLSQNYPNPFNPVTAIHYDLPEDALVNITIYDMMGRIVKTMVNAQQNAGYKSVIWDATNNAGQPVSAGLYLYTIQAGAFRQTKKMVMLK